MTELSKSARKITLTLFLAQSLFSAGSIAVATVNSIMGAELGGKPWAGVPSAVFLLGSALAASIWGVLMDTIGRRNGIAFGLLLGVAGAGMVVLAVNQSLLILMLIGMTLLGFAQAAMLLGRFAAAEVNPPLRRGSAISNVVLGGAVGAIVGPLLVGPMGKFALRIGMNELAGAYIAGLILFGIASVIISIGLRPDPRDLGKQVAALYPDVTPEGEARPIGVILRQPAALTAVTAMVLGQVVMVAIMGITALHMGDHDHQLSAVSAVISAHTLGMYAFSVLSGRLADKWGRGPVILTGAATLLLACLTAPLSPNVLPLAVSLFLLGLGWNFCFVGGSTLLADQLSPAERARTQGRNDLLVGLASATSVFSSGLIYDATSYTVISLMAGALSLIPLVMVLAWMRRERVAVRA
ncbi:MAG: MFS transporter [Anaerolineales bacterium]|jgi:MFS family permease